MKKQIMKTKQINKKANVSNDIAVILFFAGACLMVIFIVAFLFLTHLI